MREPPRILHFPTETGGNPWGLSRAERALGARSEVVVISPPVFGHGADRSLTGARAGKAARVLARLGFASRAALGYDVLHLNFGAGLLPGFLTGGAEARALRRLGRRVFMTFMGSDARLSRRADGSPAIADDGSGDPFYHASDDGPKRAAIRIAERSCDRVFCLNPDLCQHVDAEFLPYTSVDPRRVRPVRGPGLGAREPGPVRIAHAPTKRSVKGTEAVIRAVAELGGDAELILIENASHARAMAACARADLLVDQLRIGWYGGLAVECMAMGIPVVAHIRRDDLVHVPRAMADELPVRPADSRTLVDVLGDLIADIDGLDRLGAESRRYVERWHDPLRIGARMLQVYRSPGLDLWSDPTRPLPLPGCP